MLFSRGALERQKKNAYIVVEETDGVARVFAKLITDQLRFAIP